MKPPYPENELLDGIRNHDSGVLEFVYQKYFPMIESFVLHNQGSSEQAKDVFQEAMIIVYKKIREGRLELSC